MKTVKEVSEISGVSVRTLQYYDEIGVLKPSMVSDAGYRYYDEDALHTLQQILFFKELDFPLKEIREIMNDPSYDKTKAFHQQNVLLTMKRDRLNKLLILLDQLEKGDDTMSFKEFDLQEYIRELERFKEEHHDDIISHWGDMESFDEMITHVKDNKADLAELAVQYYGSVDSYVRAMKHQMEHFGENMERMEQMKRNGYIAKNNELLDRITQDLTKDVDNEEIQNLVHEMVETLKVPEYSAMDMGTHYLNVMADSYMHNPAFIKAFDCTHGKGSSQFLGEALRYYLQKGK